MQKTYTMSVTVWLYPGMAGWHFITLPKEDAKDIDYYFSMAKKGWGSLPVEASIGQTHWTTSIFPDKKADSYLMPLKAEVRKKEQITEGDTVNVALTIRT